VVSLASSASEGLHLVVHRVATAGRDVDDWWGSPFETAVAAVALARHSPAYRDDAGRAVARLKRWVSDEQPRPISADVAALALTARAAADLQQSDATLVSRAAGALDDLVQRDRTLVPELHVVLASWALDKLVRDRDQTPWPSVQRWFDSAPLSGVDEPLRRFGQALAAKGFDAGLLVQALLGDVAVAPSLSDNCILLWLLRMAIERASESLPATDNALQVLVRRRAALVERLAGEITEQTFTEPAIPEFGGDDAADLRVIAYLSGLEALLVDLALASANEATPLLSFEEAEQLFGAKAAQLELQVRTDRGRALLLLSLLVGIVALLAGALTWAVLHDVARSAVAVNVAIAVASLGVIVAARLWHEMDRSARAESLLVFAVLLTLLGAINAANQATRKPFWPGVTSAFVDVAISVAAGFLASFVLGRRRDVRDHTL
jgi:hypothetical protein